MADPLFAQLPAAEVMRTDVVTVDADDSLKLALALMTENHVTGLPVLDRKERCVGVISATDILCYEQDHAEDATEANAAMARYFDPETERWESVRVTSFALEEFAEIPVSELMCRDLIFVGPDASLGLVARKMTEKDVHRILVLDRSHCLLGIISTMDVVRLVARQTRSAAS